MCRNNKEIITEKSDACDWGLCVFFSVDLEGATAYKVETRTQKGDEDWCAVFERFYVDFPEQFLSIYKPIDVEGVADATRPSLWKFVGDEILFFSPLTDSRHTLEHLNAFSNAITKYNSKLEDSHVNVRCKGTAWIAGFPVNNRIVLIPGFGDADARNIDFIGSSIDCGFRLTKFSSSRRLVVSLDLLWMFVASYKACSKNTLAYKGITFRYYGEHVLKGVFSGKAYPVFWLDLASGEDIIEDEWLPSPVVCKHDDIVKFCEKVVGRMKKSDFIRPFIIDDTARLFDKMPDGFKEQREALPAYKKEGNKNIPSNAERQVVKDVELPTNVLSPQGMINKIS